MMDEAEIVAEMDLSRIPDSSWRRASERMEAIRPLLEIMGDGPASRESVEGRAREIGRHPATLYRWLALWWTGETLSSLVPRAAGPQRGSHRLPPRTEEIVGTALGTARAKRPRMSTRRLTHSIEAECRAVGVDAPHPATVRRRRIQQELRRADKPLLGSFPGADFPLAVVQIDHTKLDLIVVDERERQPIGRPWLTLAIDVHSRMVAGFYLSLEAPGIHAVGLCLAQAILPKEALLSKHGIERPWPVSGLMTVVHADNGKEFHSRTLGRAAQEWGIELKWRPVRQPWYGGHIERLIGTSATEIHQLPGTTLSNPGARQGYDSERAASMTLAELERWLLVWITGVYHASVHRSLGTTPLFEYQKGLRLRESGPRQASDLVKLGLDLMPLYERSVGREGITIEGVRYWSDLLRPWVGVRDPDKPASKRRFPIRRDPRDISAIWLWESEAACYHRIPYRNLSHPAVSVWELRNASRRARQQKVAPVDEDIVFAAFETLRREEETAVRKTKAVRRNEARRDHRDRNEPAEAPLACFTPRQPVIAFAEIEEL